MRATCIFLLLNLFVFQAAPSEILVVRLVDPTWYWIGLPAIISQGTLPQWLSAAFDFKETVFDKIYPNIILKLGGVILDRSNQQQIIDLVNAGMSPLNSEENSGADFLSALADQSIAGIWFVAGLGQVQGSIEYLDSTIRAMYVFLQGLSPRNPPPFVLGFSGMGPLVNILGQWNFTRSIHGYLFDQFLALSTSNPIAPQVAQLNDTIVKACTHTVQFANVIPQNNAAKTATSISGYATGGLLELMAQYVQEGLISVNSQTIFMVELEQNPFQANLDAINFFNSYFKPNGPYDLPAAILIGEAVFQGQGSEQDWNTWVNSAVGAVASIAENYGVPVFSNLQIGHGLPNYAWPLGPTVMQYSAQNGTLTFVYN